MRRPLGWAWAFRHPLWAICGTLVLLLDRLTRYATNGKGRLVMELIAVDPPIVMWARPYRDDPKVTP